MDSVITDTQMVTAGGEGRQSSCKIYTADSEAGL